MNLTDAKQFLEARLNGFKPTVAIVLGSGLGKVTKRVQNSHSISFSQIPGFRAPSVQGHEGKLMFGVFGGKNVALQAGRLHAYEGCSMEEITLPVRVLSALGCKVLVVTNAAGGIHTQLTPGSLMLIDDHINLMGDNPLIGLGGSNEKDRFLDMTQAYSPRLREKMMAAAQKLGVELKTGVYLAVKGPSYETPAEVKAFAWLGADAIGMSTVPEVLVARSLNLEVVGISCVTNIAAGLASKRLSHDEVLESGLLQGESIAQLIEEFLGLL